MKWHSDFSRLFYIAAALFLFPEIAGSQISDEEILSLLAENQFRVAQERAQAAYQKNPNSPNAAYYRALFEENAEQAAASFQDLTKRFKNSEYAERALYRLGQYHFARGNYMRARQFFQELGASHANPARAAPSQYFAAKALLISGQTAQASEELQALIKNSPETWAADFARDDLARMPPIASASSEAARVDSEKKSETKSAGTAKSRYAVQAGAFTEKSKAQELEKRLKGSGYKTEVHERNEGARKYYLVWLGSFSSRDQAWNCADDLKKKYQVKSHVVRRDD
jgi:cell division septation protein DedD